MTLTPWREATWLPLDEVVEVLILKENLLSNNSR
jgi:hypothetical protein